MVREGTLRTASCVRKGMAFAGELTCAGEDVPLLKNALGCIRWMGAMRSRGFGQVRVSCKTLAGREDAPSVPETHCIRYRLRTRTPLLITDLSRSRGNSYETRAHIPGAAIRGLVAGALSASDPAWFTAHRQALLSEATRFLDAMPLSEGMVTLPAIKGYYENKEETALAFMLKDGKVEPGLKRAKLGTCCALEGDTLRYWSARTDGVTRIRRGRDGEDTLPFETRYISAGQAFEGYICLDDAALAPQIARALQKTIWLGADRYEGFGNCSLERLEAVEAPAWLRREARVEPTGNVLYLLAISPLTMQDDFGRPCGLDEAALARKLGVERVSILLCATSISEYAATTARGPAACRRCACTIAAASSSSNEASPRRRNACALWNGRDWGCAARKATDRCFSSRPRRWKAYGKSSPCARKGLPQNIPAPACAAPGANTSCERRRPSRKCRFRAASWATYRRCAKRRSPKRTKRRGT